jgi:hypothetical protein
VKYFSRCIIFPETHNWSVQLRGLYYTCTGCYSDQLRSMRGMTNHSQVPNLSMNVENYFLYITWIEGNLNLNLCHYIFDDNLIIDEGSCCVCFFIRRNSFQWAKASSFTRFVNHTQRRTTVGRTLLGEWSARRRDLYLTTHNTHNKQTSMCPPMEFEPVISAGKRPQTYALDRAATDTGVVPVVMVIIR